MCRALHSPLSCHKNLPLDMLEGLAEANTWVAKLEGHKFSPTPPPRHARGLGSKPTL
jgi:hypothetical protein